MRWSRRDVLVAGAGLPLPAFLADMARAMGGDRRLRVGACDWSMGQRQKLEAFGVAKQIGLDGVQVSFDGGEENDLRQPEVREAYAREASETGVAISSLAMGVLNKVPYATDENAERWVHECVEVMRKMGQQVVLLAFFGAGDINGKPELQKAVTERLKKVAPAAEKAGVVLGIESWMNRDDHLRIIDAVGSPAVQVYYDVANSHKMGYDIYAEIRSLKGRICQFHCKEYATRLGRGEIDFGKVRDSIEAIDFRGWLIIEAAVEKPRPMIECYRDNAAFLRTTFKLT